MPIVKVKDMNSGMLSLPSGSKYEVKDGQFKAKDSDLVHLKNEAMFEIVPEMRLSVEREQVVAGKVVSEQKVSEVVEKPGKTPKLIQTGPKKKK